MKSSTKELICAVAVLVMLGVIATLSGCTPIHHSEKASGRVLYNREGISVDEPLTEEEVATVVSVLNGKLAESIFPTEYACGYDERQALQIGFTTYYLAQDDCAYIQNGLNEKSFELTDEEREMLERIFKAHGAMYV